MRAASISTLRAGRGPLGSRRLLRLAGDVRLVEQIRAGNEAAFEVAFERHGKAILSFCRHMLGSLEEAEDAVQHTFAAAYHDLLRSPGREIALKPWLFAIARNRCLSLLRGKREQPEDFAEPTAAPLSERIEARAELRQLLADLRELPAEQRAALLLMEIGDLSQAEIGHVLDCEAARVKALVFRARKTLLDRRDARAIPCVQIQEKLANLRGGALRRNELRLHLGECADCRTFRDRVREQRGLLAAALPVAPSLGLKSAVLGAIGIGGGTGGGAAGLASLAGVAGAATAKLAAVGLVAGGAAITGAVVLEREGPAPAPPAMEAELPARPAPPRAPAVAAAPLASTRSLDESPRRTAREPASGRRGERPATAVEPPGAAPAKKAKSRTLPPGQAKRAESDDPGHAGGERPNRGSQRSAAKPVKLAKTKNVPANPGRAKKAERPPAGTQQNSGAANDKPPREPGPRPRGSEPPVPVD